VDALRALALLAVVMVNLAGYRALPGGGPLPQLGVDDGLLALLLSLLAATLLQGNGVALLTLLFGYSQALGRPGHARSRLHRLLLLGLLHGFLLYSGDVLTSYALAGYLLLGGRRQRLRVLLRSARRWLLGGLVLLGLVLLLPSPPPTDGTFLATATGWREWLALNAESYGIALFGMLLIGMPYTLGLMKLGLVAGRLRLLHHRRWRPLWQRLSRLAPLALALNLVYAIVYLPTLLGEVGAFDLLAFALILVVGPLTLLAWVPWLLLRTWPAWLQRAGRNTLSVYIGSSFFSVVLWVQVRPAVGVAAAYLLALAAWGLLMVLAARFPRLPLEAWMARRPA
jgi:uncharacterized protein